MIYKAKGQVSFTQVSNKILQSAELSMKAKGLWSYLCSLPEDWAIHKSELHNHFKDGKAAVRSAFDELVEYGLIVAVEERESDGKFKDWSYIVYQERILPDVRKSDIGKSDIRKSDTTNKQNTNKQRTPYSPPEKTETTAQPHNNPIESTNQPHKIQTDDKPNYGVASFEEFWNCYAHKRGSKKKAEQKWNRLKESERNQAKAYAIKFRENHVQASKEDFQPHAVTYLNQKRWLDDELPYRIEEKQSKGQFEGKDWILPMP